MQQADALCQQLGWTMNGPTDEGELNDEYVLERAKAVYARARYMKDGLKIAHESKRPFTPDWKSFEKSEAMQSELSQLQVRAMQPVLPL